MLQFPSFESVYRFFWTPFPSRGKAGRHSEEGDPAGMNDSQHALFAHFNEIRWWKSLFGNVINPRIHHPKNHQKCINSTRPKWRWKMYCGIHMNMFKNVQLIDDYMELYYPELSCICCGNLGIALGISIQTISDTTMPRRQRHQQHQAVSWRWCNTHVFSILKFFVTSY